MEVTGLKQNNHTHLHTYWQFRVTSSPSLHVLGPWAEAGVAGGNSQRRGENVHCEAPVLITAPPFIQLVAQINFIFSFICIEVRAQLAELCDYNRTRKPRK